MLLLLSYCTAETGAEYGKRLPVAALIIISALSLAYSTARLIAERKRKRETPSYASIKQALDNLNSGVCFSDGTGRIILINRAMEWLFSGIIGSRPQMLFELENALATGNAGIEKIQESPALYRFDDKSVWNIETVDMNCNGLEGFKQTSAQEVTDIFNATRLIEQENIKLKETNEKMQLMLEHLADRIREEETLNLKTRIHNDIGSSLIEITKIIEGKTEGDMDRQLDLLQRAVSFFSNNYKTDRPAESLEKTVLKAEQMGVKLVINGTELLDESAVSLACTATDECVRNAINHAGATAVFAEISESNEGIILDFTNNGNAPRGEIREGGGLSSLRHRIEETGGRMSIKSKPEFRLHIELLNKSKRRQTDD